MGSIWSRQAKIKSKNKYVHQKLRMKLKCQNSRSARLSGFIYMCVCVFVCVGGVRGGRKIIQDIVLRLTNQI